VLLLSIQNYITSNIKLHNSIVYHTVSGSFKVSRIEATLSLYYFKRNMLITLIKNLELKNIIKIIPLHVLLSIIDAVISDIKNKSNRRVISISKAIFYLIANFKSVWIKHLKIKTLRKLSDSEILPKIILKVSILEKIRERSRINKVCDDGVFSAC